MSTEMLSHSLNAVSEISEQEVTLASRADVAAWASVFASARSVVVFVDSGAGAVGSVAAMPRYLEPPCVGLDVSVMRMHAFQVCEDHTAIERVAMFRSSVLDHGIGDGVLVLPDELASTAGTCLLVDHACILPDSALRRPAVMSTVGAECWLLAEPWGRASGRARCRGRR